MRKESSSPLCCGWKGRRDGLLPCLQEKIAGRFCLSAMGLRPKLFVPAGLVSLDVFQVLQGVADVIQPFHQAGLAEGIDLKA